MEMIEEKECLKYHNELGKELKDLKHSLFGNPDEPDQISPIDKLNIIYAFLMTLKDWAIGGVFAFIGAVFFIGTQFHQIDVNSQTIQRCIDENKQIRLEILALKKEKEGQNVEFY